MQPNNRAVRIASGAMLGIAAAVALPVHAAWNTPYTTDFGATALSAKLAAPSRDWSTAVDPNDATGKVYSLFTETEYGPYRIVRRLKSGALDTSFGSNGYINSFPNSDLMDGSRGFVALCIDPSTHYIVVVGGFADESVTPSGSKLLIQRLVPPSGSATAQVDANFNAGGTPGRVLVPGPYGAAIAAHCLVEGDGTIVVVGTDNPPDGSQPIVLAKINSDGTMANFGSNGVVYIPVTDPVSGANAVGGTVISTNPNQSVNNNFLVAGGLYKIADLDPNAAPGTVFPSKAFVAAIDRCTGQLDTRFNGTGLLINPTFDGKKYQVAGPARILDDGHIALLFQTLKWTAISGYLDPTGPGNLVDLPYPLSAGGAASQTSAATITAPANFIPHTSAFKSNGTVVAGGVFNGAQGLQQALTEYTGRADLGFTPGVPAVSSCGGGGGSTIVGDAGNNNLTGTSGNDTIDGKGGADTMTGLAGNDTYIVDNTGDKVVEVAGEGTDTIKSSVTYKLPAYVEKLTLTGSAVINGTGNSLNNVITGNAAANVLTGGSGNDTIKGLGGNDRLVGGPGNDALTGGTGQDGFLFNAALNASTNVDKVTDFSPVDDTIRLENSVFTGLPTTGMLATAAFKLGTAASTTAHRVLYDKTSGYLRYDADGTGPIAAVRFATLTTKAAITNADIVVQ